MKKSSSKEAVKVVYSTFAETFIHEEVGEYVGYGIICSDENGRELDRVDDIALDEQFVEDLADKFNRYGLSPIHLLDAVEDALP